MGPLGERLLKAQDEVDLSVLPPRFGEARALVREGIALCRSAGIGNETVAAALFSEALPRLVDLYGPTWVSGMLLRLSTEIGTGAAPTCRRQ